MQLALRLVYDINEDLQKLLVRNLEIKWNSILSELVDVDIYIYIYSSGFTEFPVLIVRHHQMNLWFYSLTRLKMRSCLRCECKSARWRKGDIKLFHNMFLSTSWYSLVASRAVYRRTPGRICVDRCNRDSLVCAVHCSCAPDLLEVLQHWWPLPHLAVLVS